MDYTPVTWEELWARDFEPVVCARRQRLLDHQIEAFADAQMTLCGEPVRQLTPRDWLQLDLLENPFICGGPAVYWEDCAGLVWELHASNSHRDSLANLCRRHRVLRRLSTLDVGAMAEEIATYLDRMLLDPSKPPAEPPGAEALKPPPRVYALAPLIVEVTAHLGHIDPMSGLLLADTPLPRLIQYQRQAKEARAGERTYTEMDSLRNKCMDRVNQINWARRHGLPEPSFPPVEA